MLKRSLLRASLALTLFASAAYARPLSDTASTLQKPSTSPQVAVVVTPAPVDQVAVVATAVPIPATPVYSVDWSTSTPALAQGNLLGGYACAPTALAMVTAHYSSRYAGASRSAQDFINNLYPGEFVPGQGVPYQKLARQIAALGYHSITGHMNAHQSELGQVLASGPIIVTAGGTVAGAKASHSLVVTALSDDGAWVKVNDPADGRPHVLSWSVFDQLWAGGSRGILIITP